ncbi:hypothetical protein DOS86_01685 [Anaplasma marginale]|uniref:hypothetical protein n=1 Tax=Anaplasma marginale TaxID=770 RepID=UPI000DEFF369|nr:hypothetical protein [Anaplasma marginale]RCL19921.1 hypothetical protein DOS86_01685 [Anaplasma marginale]TZF78828.1 hypothetical protein FY180_01825 [Anaplasma marginale]
MRGRYYETVYEESCSVPMSEILPIVREASLALSCVFFIGMAISAALFYSEIAHDVTRLCIIACAAGAGLCALVACLTTLATVVSRACDKHCLRGDNDSSCSSTENVFRSVSGSSLSSYIQYPSSSQDSSVEQARARSVNEQSPLVADDAPTAVSQTCRMRKESERKVIVISATPAVSQERYSSSESSGR